MIAEIILMLIAFVVPMSYSYNIFLSNPSSFNRHHLLAIFTMGLSTLARMLAYFFSDPETVHFFVFSFHLLRFLLYPVFLLTLIDFAEVFFEEMPRFWKTHKTLKVFLPATICIIANFVYFSKLHPDHLFSVESVNVEMADHIFLNAFIIFYWLYALSWPLYFLFNLYKKSNTKHLKQIMLSINIAHIIVILIQALIIIFLKDPMTFNMVLTIEILLMIGYSRVGNQAFLLNKPSYKLFDIFDKTEQAVAISNNRFEIIYANKTFDELINKEDETNKFFKSSQPSLIGKSIYELIRDIKDTSDSTSWTKDDIYIDFSKTIRLIPDTHNVRYVYITNSTSYNEEFQYTGSTFFIRDITEYAKDRVELQGAIKELKNFIKLNNEKNASLEEKLNRDTAMYNRREKMYETGRDTDLITGLLKKDAFDRKLVELVENKTKQFAIITLKVKNYKSFVNTQEHRFINKLLKTLTEIIRNNFSDTDLISRDNSDTFYIVTTRYVSEENLIEKVQILQSDMKRYRVIDAMEISVHTNFGISRYPKDGVIIKDLITRSETAMHKAEEENKDIILYTEELQDKISSEKRLDMEIKEGARNKEFVPFLQPVVKYVDGNKRISSYEALVRWHKKGSDKPLSPYFFISIAEKKGSVKEITANVLEYTAQFINELKNKTDEFKISVNLSAGELKDPLFIQKVKTIVDDYGIDPKYMEFEITERWLIDDVNFATQILRRLRLQGFTISIDDFGQENSSLTYLKTLPITKLKIDKTYVDQIPKPLQEGEELTEEEENERYKSTLILRTIIQLAKNLNLEVLAEGVEYDYQLEFLNKEGCHLIQGYYFYKPMPFDEIIEKEIF